MFAHALDHTPIADGGGFDVDSVSFHGLDESKIAHHCSDESVIFKFPLLFQAECTKSESAIAADDMAIRIGKNHSIGIAIE